MDTQEEIMIKYQTLIKKIESLSKELDYGTFKEHKINSRKLSNHEYLIEIIIIREGQIFIINDAFKLIDNNAELIVEYIRKTKNIIPLPSIIPELLTKTFIFKQNMNQNQIFLELLKGIITFFSDYKYVDTNYKKRSEEKEDFDYEKYFNNIKNYKEDDDKDDFYRDDY